MEWLLQHLEDSKLRHEHDEEPYLRIGCNLGWMKLDKYYTLTEDSPVYLASLVLHPAFRWPSVESQWADHPDWLERGKIAVRELWEEYRKLPVEQDTIPNNRLLREKQQTWMILWRRSGSSALSVRPQHHLHGMSTPSGCPLPTPAIAWWIIRFNTGFSDDDSIHACHEWQLTCFQFPRCLLSQNGYSVLQDRWSRLRENGCKQILSEQRGAFHRGRRVGPLRYPNRSK
jgi:hypothetical protein